MVVFCAPSGSGKTTIVHEVLKQFPHFSFSVSAATRERRSNEVDGKDYYFIAVDEFRRHIEQGDFLEWEEVYPGRYYGTLLSEVKRLFGEGKNVVFDVDVKGGVSIKNHFGDDCVAIFIKPPSLEELRKRLSSRGTDSPEEVERRLQKAGRELTYEDKFDFCVVNGNLNTALDEVFSLIREHCAG